MFKFIRRALCSHSFSWSERRKGEVCVRCGRFRAVPDQSTGTKADTHGH